MLWHFKSDKYIYSPSKNNLEKYKHKQKKAFLAFQKRYIFLFLFLK